MSKIIATQQTSNQPTGLLPDRGVFSLCLQIEDKNRLILFKMSLFDRF